MSDRGNKWLRSLDYYLGRPLIFLCSFFRKKKRIAPKTIKRIGLLLPAAIGDTIVASGTISKLHKRYPDSEVVIFNGPSNAAVFTILPNWGRTVTISTKRPDKAVVQIRAEGSFDIFIDFSQWTRLTALLSFFSKAKFTVGFQTPGQSRHTLYDIAVPHSNSKHEYENYAELLSPLDLKPDPIVHLDQPSKKEEKVLIHPVAGGSHPQQKEWPLENWASLIDWLIENGFKVQLSGGPEAKEKNDLLISRIKNSSQIENLAGKTNLKELLTEICSSQLVLSVNTGIMHLAATTNTPLIALHGPTDSMRWGPTYSPNAISVSSPLSCAPCLNLGFDYACPKDSCMRAIQVEQVKKEALSILKSIGRST